MVDFRKMIPALAVVGLLLGSAVTASAQPLSCFTLGGVNPPARAEGLTELTGDVQVQCQGGIPTADGATIPPVTIQVFLNTSITSRLMSGSVGAGFSEALLLLDEPAPGAQFGCANAGTGNVCAGVGNGLGTGYYGGGAVGTAGNNRNVFQGVQTSSNSVTFFGVPIDPPGTLNVRLIRITNIRANANQFGVTAANNIPANIQAQITSTPPQFLPVANPQQIVGSVQAGLNFSVRSSASSSGSFSPLSLQQCVSRSSGSPVAWLRYTERFGSAFKKRSLASSLAVPSVPAPCPGAFCQDNPAAGTFNVETGFTPNLAAITLPAETTSAGVGIGQADWGTRLKAVFNNIPAGVSLFVDRGSSATVVATGIGPTLPVPVPDEALWTASETGAYAPAGGSGTVQLTVSGGSASAVWEVLESDPSSIANLNFAVYASYTANPGGGSPALGTATVGGSYAPQSTVTTASATNIPRFADTSVQTPLFTIVACVTNLLFPYVTTAAGFDTGLAISATATDPWGTSAQSGTCTLNYYGAAGNVVVTTASITSGTTQARLASGDLTSITGGWSGYMIAVCRFQYAHGFAFVSDIGARNLAMGYLALIIPDPPRTPNPFPFSATGSGEQLGY